MVRANGGVIAFGAAFGVIGLAVSHLIAPPLGAPHHCNGGSRPSDCRYPPDQTSWSIWWIVGGLVLGICIGLLAAHGLKRGKDAQGQASIHE
jgi:hypothetical protein